MSIARGPVAIAVFALLCAAIVMFGSMERTADFSSALRMWSEVVRDLDGFGLSLTRLSSKEEMEVGRQVAAENTSPDYGATHPEIAQYVSGVVARVAEHVRRKKITYRFRIVDAPAPNAFALPGGYVFITTGMLAVIDSEAELAMVLGHEIAHVDLRHCIERYQSAVRLRKLGLGPAADLVLVARLPIAQIYRREQELDADAEGLSLAVQAGYDPRAAAAFTSRLASAVGREPVPSAPARAPLAELTQAAGGALSEYFRSHPLFAERINALDAEAARLEKGLKGRKLEVGTEEYRKHIPNGAQNRGVGAGSV